MSKKWVVADWHFGHAAIITYARRPWECVDKMDSDLVKLHNSVVAPGDEVYMLGDVTLRDADKVHWLRRILGKMNGTKHLIYGNHDRWHWERYLDAGFQTVHSFLSLQIQPTIPQTEEAQKLYLVDGKVPVHLCHDPAWAQDKTKLWICGHLHNCAFTAPTHIAIVSVELTEYKPVLIQDIVDGLRPGEGVLRTPPRPNREPKEWVEEGRDWSKVTYNPKYGDERLCKCGHPYYRHFDTYDNMEPVGCKYCQCGFFEEV
jgi:calcineurin-like phosphoesterase family protein